MSLSTVYRRIPSHKYILYTYFETKMIGSDTHYCISTCKGLCTYISHILQYMVCRFNGQDLLGSLKGKKLLFVGDSLSLNQWQSLTCMLHAAVPQNNYTITRKGGLSTFFMPVSSTPIKLYFLTRCILLGNYKLINR